MSNTTSTSNATSSSTSSERELHERLTDLEALEQRIQTKEVELAEREKKVKEKEAARKQVLLRLSSSLWDDVAAWAADDFRSINGQIEYILTEAVRKRKGK